MMNANGSHRSWSGKSAPRRRPTAPACGRHWGSAASTSFLTGTVAAASIGMINSIGNLGGFAGPYIVGYLNRTTHSFTTGVTYLSLSAMVAASLVLTLRNEQRLNAENVNIR